PPGGPRPRAASPGLRTGLDCGAGPGAVAASPLAATHRLEGTLTLLVGEHVLELQLDDRGDVGTRTRCSPEEGIASTEDRIEDVLEAREARPGLEAAGTQSLVAEAVVGLAPLAVGEHLVGLRCLLELL